MFKAYLVILVIFIHMFSVFYIVFSMDPLRSEIKLYYIIIIISQLSVHVVHDDYALNVVYRHDRFMTAFSCLQVDCRFATVLKNYLKNSNNNYSKNNYLAQWLQVTLSKGAEKK